MAQTHDISFLLFSHSPEQFKTVQKQQTTTDNNIPGALYQRVATYGVLIIGFSVSKSIPLDNPKSQIFNSQSEFNKMLLGFKSLCNTLALWIYLRALKIWYKKYCKCWSLNCWSLLIICLKSVSIKSVTIYTSLNWAKLRGGIKSVKQIICVLLWLLLC